MIRILIVCAGGISTSFLEQKIVEVFDKRGIDANILARSANDVYDHLDQADIVLMAPQVSYMQKELSSLCDEHHVKFAPIPLAVYGQMNGEAVCQMVMDLLK